uniref:Uncharacterized protein n=1 Tax=Octopus bimaculoides TaxID=37653 RepID=A0A0L8I7W1_OCTBM
MLSCKPAVDLFEFLAIGLVCGTVDAFNGFWFGLGWFVFFFIPGIILSVKLAKYYHRMIWSDEEDSSNIEMSFKNPGVGYASPPYFPNNKVGQM